MNPLLAWIPVNFIMYLMRVRQIWTAWTLQWAFIVHSLLCIVTDPAVEPGNQHDSTPKVYVPRPPPHVRSSLFTLVSKNYNPFSSVTNSVLYFVWCLVICLAIKITFSFKINPQAFLTLSIQKYFFIAVLEIFWLTSYCPFHKLKECITI